MDVEKILKHMVPANSEYMRKIFCILLCTLFILPSQSYSASASANDSCLSLGAKQYLEANSRLIPVDSNFTVEFDFYLDRDEKSYAEIISQGGQPNPFYVGIDPDLGIRVAGWPDLRAKMPLKKWVHIALTHTSGEVGTLYIDGKVFAWGNGYKVNNGGTATRVGAQYGDGNNERINGCIDNLMIWKSVRTPSEVFQDSLVKSPITDANLIAFYGFDSVGSTGLIEDNAVPSNSLRPLSTPKIIRIENVQSVPDFDPKNQFRLSILESEWSNPVSSLVLRKTSKANRFDFETMLCPKWGEGDCVQTAGNHYYQYEGTVVLPVCAESSAVYCIEGLELKNGEGNWRKAPFNRSIAGPVQTAVPEIGYPGGGTISLFETGEDAKSQDLDGYAIYAAFELHPMAMNTTKPRFERLDLRVIPYTRETGVFSEQIASTNVQKDGTKQVGFSGCSGLRIVWCEASQRGRPTDFPKDVAARVTLRVPNALTGWLGGRLTKAEIGVTKIDATTNQLKIGGYPATVGLAVGILERASLPHNLPDWLKEHMINYPSSDGTSIRGSEGILSFGALDAIKDSMKDKSVREETVWSLSSYGNSDTQCLQDDSNLVGLVTTNATAFAGVPPSFEGGILTYKIGGLHYDSKGGLTSGNYDLVIRSDVARCLYKFTKAPIQASISIAYETGEEKIATQIVNERDGWLHLGAYNFSYSAPTIRIKLTQDAVADSPTPKIAISSPKKMSTITCTKGKTSKKITGVIPKCPVGYKKK